MPRNVTVTFDDGSTHVYQGVPDSATPEQVQQRAAQDFAGKAVKSLDGGRKGAQPQQATQEQPQARSNGFIPDAINAVSTGFNRGMARLAGLPADTAQNVIDLAKAAVGAPYTAITGKVAPDWLQVAENRNNVIGSGDYILNKIRHGGADMLVDPQNPEYDNGYLQAIGSALPGAVNKSQAGSNAISAIAGKAVYDLTGNQALAIAAGMAPTAARQGFVEGTKRLVRGGEQGRQQMAQRVADLKAAGIENPSLGLASGNETIGAIENLLQNTPGAVKIMGSNRDAAIQGLENSIAKAAYLASTNRGAMESGRSIQAGGKAARDAFKAKQAQLYDKLDQYIDKQQPVKVDETRQALSDVNSDIKGAPELSKQFKNARIGAIENAILKDSGILPTGASQAIQELVFGKGATAVGVDMMGRPIYRGEQTGVSVQPGVTVMRDVAPPMRQDMMGNLVPVTGAQGSQIAMKIPAERVPQYSSVPMARDSFNREIPVAPIIGQRTTIINPSNRGAFSGIGVPAEAENTLPFEAVKKTRTLVGNEIADNSLMSDVPRSKWNPIYAALSRDLEGAANAAGPQAQNAFQRASDYTRAGIGRLERIAPVIDRQAPEQSFTALANTLKENTSTFQAVKKSLPQDARGDFAGTIIERLGKATPGQQDATGGKWSPETFLTNWSKIKPEAQAELLSGIPNAAEVKQLVDSVAQTAALMRANSKMWANPSGTAANATARGIIGTIGAGGVGSALGMIDPTIPIMAGLGLGGINLTARAVTSPNVRNAMLQRSEISPERQNALIRAMISSGQLAQDRDKESKNR